jgi:ComF family protein
MVTWADAGRRVERWLLPPACIACGLPVTAAEEPLVCAVCRARWRAIPAPACPTCGEPAPLALACRVCADWPPDFGPAQSAVELDPPVRRLVHRFKYQGWWRLAASFATRMAPLLRGVTDVDLVPVPLSPARLRQRGYNQAERLAEALGALTGLPVCAERMARVRDTPTQTRLTPEHRRANLAAAFAAAECHRAVMLVDDVFTTGATLCSAATALLERGAERVGGITFARAPLPLAGISGTDGLAGRGRARSSTLYRD